MSTQEKPPASQRAAPAFGDIWEVDLDPVVGAETGKRRPALVVSNDINNEHSQTVTVLPITGQPSLRHYPFEVPIPKGIGGLTVDSRIKANQVRTVDCHRLLERRGKLPPRFFPLVARALKIHLNME